MYLKTGCKVPLPGKIFGNIFNILPSHLRFLLKTFKNLSDPGCQSSTASSTMVIPVLQSDSSFNACAEQFSDGVAFDPHTINYLYVLTEIGQNPICVFFLLCLSLQYADAICTIKKSTWLSTKAKHLLPLPNCFVLLCRNEHLIRSLPEGWH